MIYIVLHRDGTFTVFNFKPSEDVLGSGARVFAVSILATIDDIIQWEAFNYCHPDFKECK